MRNIICLYGKDCEKEKELIESTIKEDPIYVLDSPGTELYNYIDYLHDNYGLKNSVLHRFKVCREFPLDGNVSFYPEDGGRPSRPSSMKKLLELLEQGKRCSLVVENNDRVLLSNIVQQLIYIGYPLPEVDVKLRREFKDAARSACFMKRVEELYAAAAAAVEKLNDLCVDENAENREDLYKTRAMALEVYEKIRIQIEKARGVEMKVAIAASKKTGKSTIVDCLLGMELAPTSLEMATPNSCIYRKSSDERFHLSYKGRTYDFDSAKQLYDAVNNEFRRAQDDGENGFTIPDMDIFYVKHGSNFENYTIYDTPGPDLACTGHKERASKAIEECDVVLFAIDYTKYLTTTEEEYLREIKTLFEEKNKFHSLIFVINKLDEALSDKGPKSIIKSIDFIRSRLRRIDARYADCSIFATSAQDYFYTVELRDAARENPALARLLEAGADWFERMRRVMSQVGGESEDLDRILTNLDGEVSRMHGQLGYRTVGLREVENYSGMPQLMSYIDYVAQSKAREEIVNNITHLIDSECGRLQAIISKIANIEELMGKSQEEIDRISAILEEYSQNIQEALSDELGEDDFGCVAPGEALDSQIKRLQKTANGGIKLAQLLEETRGRIADVRESDVQEGIWSRFQKAQKEKIQALEGQIVLPSQVGLSEEEMKEIIQDYGRIEVKDRSSDEQAHIKSITEDLRSILSERLKWVQCRTAQCQEELEKNDCRLELPEVPVFDVAMPEVELPKFGNNFKDIGLSNKLSDVYTRLGGVHQFFRNLLDLEFGRKQVKVKIMSEKELNKEVDALHGPFCNGLKEAEIYEQVCKVLGELTDNMKTVEDELLGCFQKVNQGCIDKINIFQSSIDDRDRYQDELEGLERKKVLIGQIQDASRDFLDIWNDVLQKTGTNADQEVLV